MNLSIQEEQQREMCLAHYDGAPGILVSGLVWVTSALVCFLLGVHQGVWTLLIGGALIYPLSLVVTKALGRSAQTSKTNALNQLGMASTFWLILCCAMAYGLFVFKPVLFFPAMMATIGCRYMVFASMYGKSIFWILGVSLVASANLALFTQLAPVMAAALGGLIEIFFAIWVFSKASKA